MSNLNKLPVWDKLVKHQQAIAETHMRDMFASDPKRFDKHHLKLADILVDYSKHRINDETLPLLFQLAREANIEIFDADFAAHLEKSVEEAMTAGAHEVTADNFNRSGRLTRLAQWASYRFTRMVIDALNLAKKN